jgi:hypothetical protein
MTSVETAPPAESDQPQRPRRRRVLGAGAAAFLIVAGIVAWLVVRDDPSPRKAPRVPSVSSPSTQPTAPPVIRTDRGIWLGAEEIAALGTDGPAWESLLSRAEGSLGSAEVADANSVHDTATLATALAAARTNRADLREKAEAAIVSAIGTEDGGNWLAVGRNVGAYAIAADVLDLRADGDRDSAGSRVQAWLARFLTRTLEHNNEGTQIKLRDAAWNSGSNASAQEGFVHAAVASYLGDASELAWAWDGFRRYAGDRSSPHHLTANDSSWQVDPDDPVGIQDAGAMKNDCRLDGAIGNDMSRGGGFKCEPKYTQYPWVGLEGAVPAAMVLDRAGFPAFEVGDQAIKRALDYLWDVRQITGKEKWFDGERAAEIVYLVNRTYGTDFPVSSPTGEGRTIGWTDWTHPIETR